MIKEYKQYLLSASAILCCLFGYVQYVLTDDTSIESMAQISIKVNKFKENLKKFKPNAPWIVREFMDLPPDEFMQAFIYTIDILTDESKRWHYFSNKPEEFRQESLWFNCLWQCMFFDYWLEHTYLLVDSNLDQASMIFKTKPPTNAIKLSTLLFYQASQNSKSLDEKVLSVYKQLYTFYFDCLSNIFSDYIETAYKFIDDNKELAHISKELGICYKKMKYVIAKLEAFNDKLIIRNYISSFKRYESILDLLNKERYKIALSKLKGF
jgi:hypothetical protein